LGEAARHATTEFLRTDEQRHVESCERCRQLYEGYRLTDRLLASSWRQTTLPAASLEALEERPLGERVAGVLEGAAAAFGSRAVVPAALAVCLAMIVGLGVLLPALLPSPPAASASHPLPTESSPTPSPTPTAGPTSVALPDASPTPGPTGRPSGTRPGATPARSAPPAGTPVAGPPTLLTSLGGWPVAWSSDGRHFMTARGSGWTRSRQIQISDAAGRVTGTFNADSAVWVDRDTIAATRHATSGGSGWPRRSGATTATVSLINLNGHVAGSVDGRFAAGGSAMSGATLLGSGTGYLAIADQGNWGSADSSFVIWDGARVGSSHSGVPIAFSRDSKKIALMHPSGGPGGGTSGWLEIVSAPGLNTLASFSHTTVRVTASGDGPGFAPDVAFSPDGQFLLVSGVLVDLSRGSAKQVGDGGWLADGTLVTSATGGVVLQWQGGNSTADTRFPAGGSIDVSQRGDVLEYFGDGRSPMLLTSDGTFRQLNLNGIASIDVLSLAPDGGAVAVSGRASDGSRVTAVALLR
jgi:hypothetical protein